MNTNQSTESPRFYATRNDAKVAVVIDCAHPVPAVDEFYGKGAIAAARKRARELNRDAAAESAPAS